VIAWLAGLIVRRTFAAWSAGNWRAPVRMFTPDAVFAFAGQDHELAGERRGRAAIEEWFRRADELFVFDFEIHDVVVSGLPWNLRVATRFTNNATIRATGRRFENRGMQYARLRWGRVFDDAIYDDTAVVGAAVAEAVSAPAGTP
jgi:ketosteroid isomerase-like protein